MKTSVQIKTTEGLHALIAVKMVQAAQRYNVDVELEYNDKVVDIKSILGLMSLAVPQGENITLTASGERSEEAVYSIIEALKSYEREE